MNVVQAAQNQGNITDFCYNEMPVASTQFEAIRFMSADLQSFTKMELQQTVLPIISHGLHQMREVVLFWIKLGSKSFSIFSGTKTEIKLSVSA